jgi:hypothetical protein
MQGLGSRKRGLAALWSKVPGKRQDTKIQVDAIRLRAMRFRLRSFRATARQACATCRRTRVESLACFFPFPVISMT